MAAKTLRNLQFAICNLQFAIPLLLTAGALSLAGCVTTDLEQAHDYNQDGIELFQRGEYMLARESFKAALALEPDDPGIFFNIGQCYDRLGKQEKAENAYRECLARSPNHVPCRHALVVLLVNEGRRPDAVALVQDWITREPKRSSPYAEDAWLWHEAGDLPRAQARLQQALELDPHDNWALTQLAVVYEDMHRPDRALMLYERVLDRDPSQQAVTDRVNFLLAKGAGQPRPD